MSPSSSASRVSVVSDVAGVAGFDMVALASVVESLSRGGVSGERVASVVDKICATYHTYARVKLGVERDVVSGTGTSASSTSSSRGPPSAVAVGARVGAAEPGFCYLKVFKPRCGLTAAAKLGAYPTLARILSMPRSALRCDSEIAQLKVTSSKAGVLHVARGFAGDSLLDVFRSLSVAGNPGAFSVDRPASGSVWEAYRAGGSGSSLKEKYSFNAVVGAETLGSRGYAAVRALASTFRSASEGLLDPVPKASEFTLVDVDSPARQSAESAGMVALWGSSLRVTSGSITAPAQSGWVRVVLSSPQPHQQAIWYMDRHFSQNVKRVRLMDGTELSFPMELGLALRFCDTLQADVELEGLGSLGCRVSTVLLD